MCLIIYSKSGRPKQEYIENGEASNDDGTGIAWIENGYLRYIKGIDLKETIKLSQELPLGYIIHFRMASIGGVDPQLIHPFPVNVHVPLQQKGKANKLLFHNGHWHSWKQHLMDHLSPKVILPEGKWSDTRAIALLTAIHGKNFLRTIADGQAGWAGKFALMTPSKTTLIGRWEEEEGVFYSNANYKWSYHRSNYNYSGSASDHSYHNGLRTTHQDRSLSPHSQREAEYLQGYDH